MLDLPFEFLYTDRMKIKNNLTNYSVNELVDLICELQVKNGNGDWKHSYALGTVQAILDWEVKGYNTGFRSLQETINGAYDSVKKEMEALKYENLQKVCNKSPLGTLCLN